MNENKGDYAIVAVIPLSIIVIIFFAATVFAQDIALKITNILIDYSWIVLLLTLALCFVFSYIAHEYESKLQRGIFGTFFALTSSFKVILGFGAFLPAVYAYTDSSFLGRLIGLFVLIAIFAIISIFSTAPILLIKFIRYRIDMESFDYIPLKLSLTFLLDLFLTAISYLFLRGFCIYVYEEAFQTYMSDSIYAYVLLLN